MSELKYRLFPVACFSPTNMLVSICYEYCARKWSVSSIFFTIEWLWHFCRPPVHTQCSIQRAVLPNTHSQVILDGDAFKCSQKNIFLFTTWLQKLQLLCLPCLKYLFHVFLLSHFNSPSPLRQIWGFTNIKTQVSSSCQMNTSLTAHEWRPGCHLGLHLLYRRYFSAMYTMNYKLACLSAP